RQALYQRPLEALCIGLVLETHDEIITVANQVRLSLQPWLHHPLEPQVKHVVKVEVAEHDANTAPLRDPFLGGLNDPVFQHPSFQPPSDQPQDARVSDTVLHKAQEPCVI